LANQMFKNIKKSLTQPVFTTRITETGSNHDFSNEKRWCVEVLSKKSEREEEWTREYYREYPYRYELLDYKIKVIQQIIRDSYFNLRNSFKDNVMFSYNGILFKNLDLDYERKILRGTIIEEYLLMYLPINKRMEFDIIDNKGGLRFFETNEVVVTKLENSHYNFYANGESLLRMEIKPEEDEIQVIEDVMEEVREMIEAEVKSVTLISGFNKIEKIWE
jgi:hypothetical protein